MLHLMANFTSPYYYDLLSTLLLFLPILLPHYWLMQFSNPMDSELKIASNPWKWSILLSIMIVWGDIIINNAKATSFFKCGPSLISSNVKLIWSSTWKSLMVNPRSISSPIMLYQTCFRFRLYSNLLVLGLYYPSKHLIKSTMSYIGRW